jgi:hypothetical protein
MEVLDHACQSHACEPLLLLLLLLLPAGVGVL